MGLRGVRSARDTSLPPGEGFHAVVERRPVDAEQARRLADVAVRQLQGRFDVVALGFRQMAVEAEQFRLLQALIRPPRESRRPPCRLSAAVCQSTADRPANPVLPPGRLA